MRILKTKKSFRKELKRQLRYAIAAAAGFLIIFAWRDAIINASRNLVKRFAETTPIATTEVTTAVFFTIIGVIIIIISSKLLKD